MKIGKRIFAFCLSTVLLLMTFSMEAMAASAVGAGIVSNNIHDHVYDKNSKVANSYLMNNGNGTLTRVENFGNVLLVENYNAAFQLLSQGALGYELSIFGGFYSGSQYNYVLFGQTNPYHDGGREVIRIVRYTKNWVRISATSVSSCNTETPFYGCNTSFAEYGNNLFIRMGRTDYLGQQGTMTLTFDNQSGKVVDRQTGYGSAATGCQKNTAASYIDANNGVVSFCDDVKAPEASITMSQLGVPASGNWMYVKGCYYAQALGKIGSVNGRSTETSLGGYATNTQYAIAVGTTTPNGGGSTSKNVFVMVTPKGSYQTGSVQMKYLTGFAYEDMTCTTPYLVPVGNSYMVLWEQRKGYGDMEQVYYCMLDEKGNRIGDVKSIAGCLSDCQPILFGNNVVWYTTNGAVLKFYAIPVTLAASYTNGSTVSATTVFGGVDYSAVYDFGYYCSKYPDVALLYGNNPQGALYHFVASGMPTGRQGAANFNAYSYKKKYPDLAAVYGDNWTAYYLHFVLYGYKEGRSGY